VRDVWRVSIDMIRPTCSKIHVTN